MKRYTKLIVAAIIALIFIGTFVFLWQKSQPKEIRYTELKPSMQDIRKTTIITGKIEPRNEVNVKPQISGIISDLLKEPGQHVQEGEVIAKVKVIPDMGQLSSAESRVRLADINLRQTETDYARMNQLHGQQLVSDEDAIGPFVLLFSIDKNGGLVVACVVHHHIHLGNGAGGRRVDVGRDETLGRADELTRQHAVAFVDDTFSRCAEALSERDDELLGHREVLYGLVCRDFVLFGMHAALGKSL